ncbi:MAG: ABC transporter substrate-binding protein [Desulfobacterales bacterium]|jgi:phospholipid transport system substrate-binding protein
MNRILYTALILLVMSTAVLADDKHEAQQIVKNKLDAVFAVLNQQDIDQQAKKKEVDAIVTPMFDFELMAKLTLGKKYWPDLSEEKRAKYIQLYINRLKTSYLDKLTLYTDEKVVFEPPVQVEKKVQIPTQLVSKERKTSILYKLYKSDEAWKVYDLEIQGVSIIRSYRSQFYEILQKGTIDDLLKKLEKPANT